MQLEKITFTGVDLATPLNKLSNLAAEFPNTEFGILLSASKAGKDRKYPPLHIIEDITKAIPKEQLALHLCGSLCKDLLQKGIFPYQDLLTGFSRVQLNFSYDKVGHIDYCKTKTILKDVETIIQLHGRNANALFKLQELNARISALNDNLGGRGISTKWEFNPPYRGIKYGYAGGLGPGNLNKRLKLLDNKLTRDEVTWVDMETHIRKDNWFSIDRAQQCLKEAKVFL